MPRRSERIRERNRMKVGSGAEVNSPNVEDPSKYAVEGDVAARDGTAGSSSTTKTRIMQNPLENTVVLNHLFELCPVNVLATCRLVCKQWYNESLAAWRTNSTLSFSVGNEGIVLLKGRPGNRNEHLTFKKFLKYLRNPENKCSTKPYCHIRVFGYKFSSSPRRFVVFWKVLGPNMATLKLENCKFDNVEEFRKIVYTCCPNLQCLELSRSHFPGTSSALNEGMNAVEFEASLYGENKHLKSVCIRWTDVDESKIFPVSWLEFFSHYPFLTSFKIDELHLNCQIDFTSLAEAIRTVRRQNADKLPFKTFSVDGPIYISRGSESKHLLDIAREIRLPLAEDLRIRAHPELELDFLKSTLNFHSKTVKSIYAYLEEDDNGLTTPTTLMREFPFGINLHNLEYFEIEVKLCESFTFIKYMPNLEKLVVVVEADEDWPGQTSNPDKFTTTSIAVSNTSKHELAQVKMLRLTELVICCVVSDEDVRSLIQWMPNVERLTMILNDEQFGIICGKWRFLKEVNVLGYELTDKGITGRSGREANGEDASVSPNITYLQDLECVSFVTTNLTHDSVFHGFLKLPKLQRIFYHADESAWGEESRKALETRNIEVY